MDEDIKAIVERLERGININRETVEGLHEMEVQLHAVSAIGAHFMQEGEWVEFLTDVSELIWDLLVALKMEEDGELHLIAEGQAAKKLARRWTLKHIARIKEEIPFSGESLAK